MSETNALEYGDLPQLKSKHNLTRGQILKILQDPEIDRENYKNIIAYLKDRNNLKKFYSDNEKHMKETLRSVNNLKVKFDRNKKVTGYNVRNILANINDLQTILKKITDEYQRTFIEK